MKKISVAAGAFLLFVEDDTDLTLFTDTKYGYGLNIHHPRIREHYTRFKAKYGIPAIYPPTDEERYIFETTILKYLKIDYEFRHGWGENFIRTTQNEKQPA